jgi:superfamily II DNA or RNA helicase/uncharacterized protein (UPF0333 family)
MSLKKKMKMIHSKFKEQGEVPGVISGILDDKNLYEHQREALQKIMEYFDGSEKKFGLVVLPTGSGKSGIIALSPYILKKERVLILTPSIYMSRQIHRDFCFNKDKTFYEKVGLIDQESIEDWCENGLDIKKTKELVSVDIRMYHLIICNAQKFGDNSGVDISKIPKDIFDLVIIDEGHHYSAKTWSNVVDHFDASILFFTATPFNKGSPIFHQEHWIYYKSYEEINKAGIIRNLEFEEFGDILDTDENIFIQTSKKIMDILGERKNHQAMILMRTKAETEECVSVINKFHSRELALPYHSDSQEINLDQFKENNIKILVVCGKLLEGFDRKEVSVICILRKIQKESRVLFTQFVGRGVRKLSKSDDTTTKVLSHSKFQQKENFKVMESFNSTLFIEDKDYNSVSDIDPIGDSTKIEEDIIQTEQNKTVKKIGAELKNPFNSKNEYSQEFIDYLIQKDEVTSLGVENNNFIVTLDIGQNVDDFKKNCKFNLEKFLILIESISCNELECSFSVNDDVPNGTVSIS